MNCYLFKQVPNTFQNVKVFFTNFSKFCFIPYSHTPVTVPPSFLCIQRCCYSLFANQALQSNLFFKKLPNTYLIVTKTLVDPLTPYCWYLGRKKTHTVLRLCLKSCCYQCFTGFSGARVKNEPALPNVLLLPVFRGVTMTRIIKLIIPEEIK